MTIVKTVGAAVISFVLFTAGFVALRLYLAGLWKTRATGITLLRYWTVQSPLYWLLAAGVVGGVAWVLVRH